MSFAYGRETQDRVLRALSNLQNFQGNDRSALSEGLTGLNGPYRRLTNVRYGALPREYAETLDTAVYVVYCYGTPIAWVTADDEDATTGRINWMPDWQYSATTTYYQGLVMQAWGTSSDPDPRKSKRDNRGSARGRTSDERYGRIPVTADQRATARGYVEAREAMEPARLGRTRPGVPAHLLDARFSNPDWSPGLPEGAHARDHRRVEDEMTRTDGYRRAHP